MTRPNQDEPPAGQELSAEEAAGLLNVSRGHLETLLDGGTVPSRKVGTERRVRRDDLLAYKRGVEAKRHAALDELAALSQDLKLGY